ncbi:MAG: 5-oxoprolinase subunit PxpA [Oleiphilaceae bacterium]|nr:5-oxoprolinase subunit PxpA [Oleiphilaceae bacterium]
MTRTTPQRLLLNCDMGESFGQWTMGRDEQVMPLVELANVACGFHASDPVTIHRTLALAAEAGTRVGAHPSYPDLAGFGRRSMDCSHEEVVTMVRYQVGALEGLCRAHGITLHHVKPHGALYNDMMKSTPLQRAVLEALSPWQGALPLMVLAGVDNSALQDLAAGYGVPLLLEAFADRVYEPSGQLRPRSQPGAVHSDPQAILQQALGLARDGHVATADGGRLSLPADTLCVHGDNDASVESVRAIREALDRHYGGL